MTSQQQGSAQGDGRNALASALRPVVADAVAAVGFDLEALDVTSAGRRRLVKVIVDADDGVDLDLLPSVSRAVSAALDEQDEVLAGPYTLEVSSPGVDRPLTRPRHWRRAKLRLVRVRRDDGTEFTVRVGAADEDGVQVLADGQLRHLRYDSVAKAVVEVEFKQPPSAELLLLERGDAAQPREDSR